MGEASGLVESPSAVNRLTVSLMHGGNAAERWHLGHRPGLDGLRGISILLVVIGHSQWEHVLREGGGTGVALFFVLSGFLITSLLIGEREDAGRIDLVAFYRRRVARLLPALLAVGVACLLIGKPVLHVLVAVTFLADFAVGSGMDLGPLTHTWSLAVEEQFYLIAPLSLVLARGRWRRWVYVVAAGVVAVTAWRLVFWVDFGTSWRWIYNGPGRMDGIAVGCLLAAWFHIRGRDWKPPRLLTAVAAVFVFFYASAFVAYGWPWFTLDLLVLSLAGAVLVAWAAATSSGWLCSRPLVFAGKISYGWYLWHYPIFGFIDNRALSEPVDSAAKWVVSFAVAVGSTYLLERPAQRVLRPGERSDGGVRAGDRQEGARR